jgi:hypothetical protein
MSFNIHQIDNLDFDDAEAEEALEDYQDALKRGVRFFS